MTYNILAVPNFKKELKKLYKKYPSIKQYLEKLIEKLKENPFLGTLLANNCYKIRLAISSKGKGKSAGARIITTIIVEQQTIFLLTIYDKSDKETISNK